MHMQNPALRSASGRFIAHVQHDLTGLTGEQIPSAACSAGPNAA